MKRLLWLALLLWLLAITPLAVAQENEDLPLQYTFIDGTTFNYPGDFSIYDEEDDGVFIANDMTDIYVFTLYERSQARNNVTNLPEAIDAFIGDNWEYEPSDATILEIGGQEAASFTYYPENSSGSEFERTLYAMYVGNGSIAIISVIPVSGRDITETERVLQILATLRYVDTSGGGTVLGNVVDLPNEALIEHRDSWEAAAQEDSVLLTSENTEMRVQVFTREEISERGFKVDPIDVLYGLFAPFDENIDFESIRLTFPQLAGREITRYQFTDVRDGERVEHLFLVFEMRGGLFVFVDIVTTDPLYRDEVAVEEMLLTVRMQGDPPPYRLTMQASYNLHTGATIRFPNNWTVIESEDNDTISINSVESNLFVLIYTEAEARENGYLDGDVVDALLAILSPLDESLSFSRADVMLITLDNGNEAARLDYRETNESGVSYDRIVVVQRLEDNSIAFTGLVPQPGLEEITPEMEAVTIAIIGTLRAR